MNFNIDSTLFKDAYTICKNGPNSYLPHMFTGPEDELLACRTTAWLGSNLNMSPVYDITGTDAVQLLNRVCVNRDFSRLNDKGTRHVIMCNDRGQMLADGVLLRLGENHFRTYWLAPVLAFYVETLGLDVQGEYITDEYFYQLDGPKSLEILEAATGCDLHDLRFAQHRLIEFGGKQMRVLRLGMSGALAYELHGSADSADEIYALLCSTGKRYGLRQLGSRHYCVNHTQAGYPNQNIHFQYANFSSGDALKEYLKNAQHPFINPPVGGSCADDRENYYMTPYDVGWGYLVRFDHDFIGREALEAVSAAPAFSPVTLEWNPEDVGDIFASQFRGADVKPYDHIDMPWEVAEPFPMEFRMEKVFDGEKLIGKTSGRIYDYYHHTMISIGFLPCAYADRGGEVSILFGSPGHPQKKVRAKIARFPYYNEACRNETFDTAGIPKLS